MCELLAVNAKFPFLANPYLEEFYSHSHVHADGWGIAWRQGEGPFAPVELHKGSEAAYESAELAALLARPQAHRQLIAHIRRATCGTRSYENSHPFEESDASGRTWVIAHNGAVVNDDFLPGYERWSSGETDSEWVALFLLDVLDEAAERAGHTLSFDERFDTLASAIARLSSGNLLNLVIDDGTYLYAHSNTALPTLHYKELPGAVVLSSQPLDEGLWKPAPSCQLMAWKQGELVRQGRPHCNPFLTPTTLSDYLTATATSAERSCA